MSKKKRNNSGTDEEDDEASHAAEDDDWQMILSTDSLDLPTLETQLREIGFLDPSLGVREKVFARDPLLSVLYAPETPVPMDDKTVPLIDSLLTAAHKECSDNLGEMFDSFGMIQKIHATLMESQDTHIKQFVFLCLLAVEEGLQNQLRDCYPKDGGQEVTRVTEFVHQIRFWMEKTINTAYVDVQVPDMHNVDHLLTVFLRQLSDAYPY